MPGLHLLRRTKSLRLKRWGTSTSDHEKPNDLDFGFNDPPFFNGKYEDRRSLEAAVRPHARSGYPCVGPILQEAIDAGHGLNSPDCSPTATSSSYPHYASYLRNSEIGLAISSPWESPQFALPSENVQNNVSDVIESPGWPTFVQSASVDNDEDSPGKPNQGTWKIITGLLRKKSSSGVSSYQQSTQRPSQEFFHGYKSHQHTPQEDNYTYRCPPEWEYTHQYPPDMDQPLSNSYMKRPQPMNHGPQRKHSWRRTLSRKKYRGRESRHNIQHSSTWPLSPVASRNLQDPLRYSIFEDEAPSSGTSEGSFLQVEIPTIQMERYSIMFSSLLQPAQSSSLLTRRQGHLTELRLENGMGKSPSYS